MKLQIYISGIPENLHILSADDALLRMLARGRVQWIDEAWEACLCKQFGIAKQQDWPLAALSRMGEGLPMDDGYWLLVSPVNLLLQRDSFLLNQPVPVQLSAEEDAVLRHDLNQHFAVEGLEFLPGAGGHWYLRLPVALDLVTMLASTVVGQDVMTCLPQGHDAQRWRQLINEAQMLLFNHPVNQARESRGEAVINSLWLHGGGAAPAAAEYKASQQHAVYAHDASVRGISLFAGIKPTLFHDLAEVLQQEHESALLQLSLSALDNDWVEQLWQALKNRRVQRLELYLAWPGRMLHITLRPWDVWKFWRKSKTIEAYF